MTDKLDLKEILAAVDINASSLWDELSEQQRKNLQKDFFILNRYISNVSDKSKETQEYFVLAVNEYFNKHFYTLSKHPKLQWKLLCMCSHENKKIFFHEWISTKKKSVSKVYNFLELIYPDKKDDEILVLCKILSPEELKELAEMHGYDNKQISKLF